MAFDMLVHNHASTFVYVRCKIRPINVAQVAIANQENLVL
jgi:hypothetical protein